MIILKVSDSGVLWQRFRLLSVENSSFPCFSVSFTFHHEIISMTVLNKADLYLYLFITVHAQKKQFL